jgi:hypothetical protein
MELLLFFDLLFEGESKNKYEDAWRSIWLSLGPE